MEESIDKQAEEYLDKTCTISSEEIRQMIKIAYIEGVLSKALTN
jgi:hypothetical protein